jgi:hypothetical protein
MEASGYKRFYKLYLTHYGTKATQCTRNLMTFSTMPCTHRSRCWKSGGKQKASIVTPTTSTFPIVEILNPFTFWFHLYAIDYLESCFDHLITLFPDLNRLTMGAETYSILVVTVSSGLENEGSMNLWFFERYSMY